MQPKGTATSVITRKFFTLVLTHGKIQNNNNNFQWFVRLDGCGKKSLTHNWILVGLWL